METMSVITYPEIYGLDRELLRSAESGAPAPKRSSELSSQDFMVAWVPSTVDVSRHPKWLY
jgi:hypothetical protein